MKIVAVSGYFDILHSGHLKLFEDAKKLGDKLVVIINNDNQQKLKGSKHVLDERTRLDIINSLSIVDLAILSIDQDRTVSKTLEYLKPDIFANGGDRNNKEVPESKICKKLGIEMIDNVGGEKINSSSKIINNIK